MKFLYMLVVWFVITTLLYFMISVYSRSVRREKLFSTHCEVALHSTLHKKDKGREQEAKNIIIIIIVMAEPTASSAVVVEERSSKEII